MLGRCEGSWEGRANRARAGLAEWHLAGALDGAGSAAERCWQSFMSKIQLPKRREHQASSTGSEAQQGPISGRSLLLCTL